MKQSFLVDMYKDKIIGMTRGVYQGNVINAKPVLMMSIFILIEKGLIVDNHICYSEMLLAEYRKQFVTLTRDKETPMFKPYVFMSAEPFYHIKWKKEQERLPHDSTSKFVRENVEYAYFDNALWDLLQDKETRDYFRESIIKNYLN